MPIFYLFCVSDFVFLSLLSFFFVLLLHKFFSIPLFLIFFCTRGTFEKIGRDSYERLTWFTTNNPIRHTHTNTEKYKKSWSTVFLAFHDVPVRLHSSMKRKEKSAIKETNEVWSNKKKPGLAKPCTRATVTQSEVSLSFRNIVEFPSEYEKRGCFELLLQQALKTTCTKIVLIFWNISSFFFFLWKTLIIFLRTQFFLGWKIQKRKKISLNFELLGFLCGKMMIKHFFC